LKLLILLFTVIFVFANPYNKSYQYEKIGDYKDAIKTLIPIYKQNKNDYFLNLRLGYLFFLNKKYSNALYYYNRAQSIKSNSFEPKLGLLRIYLHTKQYKIVLKNANVILRKDFYNYYANKYIIKALIGLGFFKESIKYCNKMLRLYPNDVSLLLLLGYNYNYVDKETAKDVYKKVLLLDPNNVAAHIYLNNLRSRNVEVVSK